MYDEKDKFKHVDSDIISDWPELPSFSCLLLNWRKGDKLKVIEKKQESKWD